MYWLLLENFLISSFVHLLNYLGQVAVYFLSSLCTLDANPLLGIKLAEISSHSVTVLLLYFLGYLEEF